jgi:pyruvate carboxylase
LDDWKTFSATFGEVSSLPTNLFLNPMKVGDEVSVELGSGRVVFVRLSSIQEVQPDGTRTVVFEVNGETWYMPVSDKSSEGERTVREKADGTPGSGHVGAP